MGGTYFEEFLAKGLGIDSFYPEESYPTLGVGYGEESGIHLVLESRYLVLLSIKIQL